MIAHLMRAQIRFKTSTAFRISHLFKHSATQRDAVFNKFIYDSYRRINN